MWISEVGWPGLHLRAEGHGDRRPSVRSRRHSYDDPGVAGGELTCAGAASSRRRCWSSASLLARAQNTPLPLFPNPLDPQMQGTLNNFILQLNAYLNSITGGWATTTLSNAALPQALGNLGLQVAAKCNVVETMNDGSIAAASNQFTSSAITFTAADIGKSIVIAGAGAGRACRWRRRSSAGSYPGHTATLGGKRDNVRFRTSALEDVQPAARQSGAGSYAPGDTITLAGGTSTTAAIATVDLTTVVSATVGSGGSGGTNGTQTVTGTTGTVLGTTTPFTASVTVSGNAITAVLSITYGGIYSANPTTITAEPVTGAGLTGAQLNVGMGVAQAHPTTAGVYSVKGTTLTQSATSGSGTGATFTSTFNAADWYYGSDDGATINAALGGTAYNGSFLLPAGGCGTTVPIVLPDAFPYTNAILRGQGTNTTKVYALAAMAEVIDTGATYSWGGGLKDLTVDAFKLATNGVAVRRGATMSFEHVAVKNALTAEWVNASGSGGHTFFDIQGYTDPTMWPAALMSTYNFDAANLTDSRIIGSAFWNAANANIHVAGAANYYSVNHTYGFPFNYFAAHGMVATGNSQIVGHEFDGSLGSQLLISGGPITVSGICQQGLSIGNTSCVEIGSGLTNINTSGLAVNQTGTSARIGPTQGIVLDGSVPSQSVLTNYPNIGDAEVSGNLAVGGALALSGNLTQTGSFATFIGLPSAAASLNVQANQTSGTNAGIFLTPRTGAFGVGLVETGNASDEVFGTNFTESMRLSHATGNLTMAKPIVLKGYTVATLPSGVTGARAYVTDADACTFGGAIAHTSGALFCPVVYNGSAWVGG